MLDIMSSKTDLFNFWVNSEEVAQVKHMVIWKKIYVILQKMKFLKWLKLMKAT